jgi:hypothetical protein
MGLLFRRKYGGHCSCLYDSFNHLLPIRLVIAKPVRRWPESLLRSQTATVPVAHIARVVFSAYPQKLFKLWNTVLIVLSTGRYSEDDVVVVKAIGMSVAV